MCLHVQAFLPLFSHRDASPKLRGTPGGLQPEQQWSVAIYPGKPSKPVPKTLFCLNITGPTFISPSLGCFNIPRLNTCSLKFTHTLQKLNKSKMWVGFKVSMQMEEKFARSRGRRVVFGRGNRYCNYTLGSRNSRVRAKMYTWSLWDSRAEPFQCENVHYGNGGNEVSA